MAIIASATGHVERAASVRFSWRSQPSRWRYFYDQWAAIEGGLTRAAIFPAFLATIVLLRATADQRPEIGVARRLFTALDRERRDSGLVVGGFLVGSILQVGVFAIMAPILGRDAPASERREVFVAAMRGMALVPLWSPFVVGMAVASQYLPKVPLVADHVSGARRYLPSASSFRSSFLIAKEGSGPFGNHL